MRTFVVRLTANESALLEGIARQMRCDVREVATEAVRAFISTYEPPAVLRKCGEAGMCGEGPKTGAPPQMRRRPPEPAFDVAWNGAMKVAPSEVVRGSF